MPSTSAISLPSSSGRTALSSSCSSSALDPGLEVVVGGGQPAGLAHVAGRAVGAGEAVQPRQERAGIRDVAAHGRVGPLALAVAVEAQVQLDQPRDRLDRLLVEAQRLEPPGRRAWRRPPRGGGRTPRRRPRSGASPACRCRAAARPGAAPGRGRAPTPAARRAGPRGRWPARAPSASARRRPCGGGARRPRAAAPAARAARGSASPLAHEQLQPGPGVRRQQQLDELVAHPLRRHDADGRRHLAHRRVDLGGGHEPELRDEPRRAHHPQRVVAERHLGRRRACAAAARRGRPARRAGRRR